MLLLIKPLDGAGFVHEVIAGEVHLSY